MRGLTSHQGSPILDEAAAGGWPGLGIGRANSRTFSPGGMPFRVDADGGGLMVAVVGAEDRLARDDAGLVAQIAAGDIAEPVAELHRRHGPRL